MEATGVMSSALSASTNWLINPQSAGNNSAKQWPASGVVAPRIPLVSPPITRTDSPRTGIHVQGERSELVQMWHRSYAGHRKSHNWLVNEETTCVSSAPRWREPGDGPRATECKSSNGRIQTKTCTETEPTNYQPSLLIFNNIQSREQNGLDRSAVKTSGNSCPLPSLVKLSTMPNPRSSDGSVEITGTSAPSCLLVWLANLSHWCSSPL
ncbi:hypothetical protein J6590_012424 [Homalodisca vitripennis]|nr:hypothetical protein J6590_012424 [Homalodisca vitripennis]